jgi:hypothetical protein
LPFISKLKFNMRFITFSSLILFLFVQSVMEPRNPELEVTGAPGELTCAKSTCHSGGNFTGTVNIEGLPDTISPGQTYNLNFVQKSNAITSGFEITSLDPQNMRSGTFVAGSGSSVAIGRTFNRQYIRQISARALTNGESVYSFSWKAPTSLTGDSIRFYFVGLAANDNGKNTLDNVLRGSKSVFFQNTISSTENTLNRSITLSPNPVSDYINLTSDYKGSQGYQIIDLVGQEVLQGLVSLNGKIDVSNLEHGFYHLIVKFPSGNLVKSFLKN